MVWWCLRTGLVLINLWIHRNYHDQLFAPDSFDSAVRLIVPVFKTGTNSVCGSHRRISLIAIVTKFLASIMQRRLTPVCESNIREHQVAFRPGWGYVNQIFTFLQLHENFWRAYAYAHLKYGFDSLYCYARGICEERSSTRFELGSHIPMVE